MAASHLGDVVANLVPAGFKPWIIADLGVAGPFCDQASNCRLAAHLSSALPSASGLASREVQVLMAPELRPVAELLDGKVEGLEGTVKLAVSVRCDEAGHTVRARLNHRDFDAASAIVLLRKLSEGTYLASLLDRRSQRTASGLPRLWQALRLGSQLLRPGAKFRLRGLSSATARLAIDEMTLERVTGVSDLAVRVLASLEPFPRGDVQRVAIPITAGIERSGLKSNDFDLLIVKSSSLASRARMNHRGALGTLLHFVGLIRTLRLVTRLVAILRPFEMHVSYVPLGRRHIHISEWSFSSVIAYVVPFAGAQYGVVGVSYLGRTRVSISRLSDCRQPNLWR